MNKKTNYLSIFIGYYKPHWKLFMADMLCAICICIVDLAYPAVTRTVLNEYLPSGNYRAFAIIIIVLVLAYVVRALCQYFVDYKGHLLGVRMEADIRKDLFCHLQKQSFRFFDQTRTGQLMSRVINDLFEIVELAHHGPEDAFISIFMIIGSFIALFLIQWKLALALLLFMPIMVGFILVRRKAMGVASKKLKEKTGVINSSLESSISGIRVAKAFSNEDFEVEKFIEGNNEYKVSKNGFYKAMGTFHAGVESMACFFGLIVLALGGFLVMQGQMTIVDLLAFNLYVASFLQPVRRLGNFIEMFEGGMAGFKRFVEVMEIDPDIKDAKDAKQLTNVKGNIDFQDVSFSYNSDEAILEHINLSIPAGRKVALVGPSGGGKTTLCHLVPRFYEVTSGSILIDKQDIKKLTLSSLRTNVGIVQQDVFLFAGTIKENIQYGNVEATETEIIEAAKKAELHDFIMELPMGYDTIVGERGARLSGGQKQRISIARIFLKNPPILILDEATSALDNETEIKIQKALNTLAKGRTSLIIAHRLSTIKDADEIIVIDEDGIKEKGSHEELLSIEGIYTRLYQAQFRH